MQPRTGTFPQEGKYSLNERPSVEVGVTAREVLPPVEQQDQVRQPVAWAGLAPLFADVGHAEPPEHLLPPRQFGLKAVEEAGQALAFTALDDSSRLRKTSQGQQGAVSHVDAEEVQICGRDRVGEAPGDGPQGL